MAAENQEQDKSESATPHKLREARKRGQVAKSTELTNAFVLAACATVLYFSGSALAGQIQSAFRFYFSQSHQITLDYSTTIVIYRAFIASILGMLWPLFGASLATAILVNMLQSGPVFTFFPTKPDLTRLNPFAGLKRIFSRRTIFETAKLLIKLLVMGTVIYAAIAALMPSLATMAYTDVRNVYVFSKHHVATLLAALIAALFVIAAIDFVYTRWDFAKKLRMSSREVKEEHKRLEGDPRIKAKIRQLRRERLKRAASVTRVKDADVVITNPTHLAVALRFDRQRMAVPEVCAKGAGDTASVIRKAAALHGVPIVENKKLARKIFWSTDVDKPIAEDCYSAVARILVWVYALRSKKVTAKQPIYY